MITPPTFPARPINGGPFDKAPSKFGKWAYELKYNGWRLLVHGPSGTAFNRKLEPSSIGDKFGYALKTLREASEKTGVLWWDCEALERRHEFAKGTLIVLDAVISEMSYSGRQELLKPCFAECHDVIISNFIYRTSYSLDGNTLWDRVPEINKFRPKFIEGIVAKRLDSLYPFQLRRAEVEFPFWVKHRLHF